MSGRDGIGGGATVAAVGRALPPHRYEQEELIGAFLALWGDRHPNPARIEQIQRALRVDGRNLALAVEDYPGIRTFGAANDAYVRVATELGTEAVAAALAQAGLAPRDVDAIFFTTVTGVAAPSIDARISNRLGMRRDLKRIPSFGLGCVAGAAGLARVADYLRGFPQHVGVLLSVELCSLTLQHDDLSAPNLVASGLFGDGAAAVVALGADRAPPSGGAYGPRVVASRSSLYPDTERVLGWDVGDSGFRIVLSASIPDIVRANTGRDVDSFLAEHGLERSSVRSWVIHPGGPKVLDAFAEALALDPGDLDLSRRSLARFGNLSSASVLFVLADAMEPSRRPAEGTAGLLAAMGPGFSTELVLLRW